MSEEFEIDEEFEIENLLYEAEREEEPNPHERTTSVELIEDDLTLDRSCVLAC